ncbi:MAG: hypothetical protein H7Y03_04135 [Chitinophagaceae bacterium]|nr:hypothetical protein [Chitinophagaceae bacterium]
MKFTISLLLIALLSFVSCLYLPWWAIGPAAFIVTVCIHQKPLKAFLAGFLALFMLWGALAWWISSRNEHLLAQKVSLLIIQSPRIILLILLTALIGALIGGLAALAGSFLRRAIGLKKEEELSVPHGNEPMRGAEFGNQAG